MTFKLQRTTRLTVAIAISFAFFLVEISVGFITGSLALQADAFHYLNDLISFAVALFAVVVSRRSSHHKSLAFGWQRAQLLGAFFNGVFLLALGVSIGLSSIERFISPEKIEDPKKVLIVGCVGLCLNIVSVLFLHEHDHDHGTTAHSHEEESLPNSDESSDAATGLLDAHLGHRHTDSTVSSRSDSSHGLPQVQDTTAHVQGHHLHGHSHDLGMSAILLHVITDALNNIAVIISSTVVLATSSPKRYYADPAASLTIALIILISSVPIVLKAGRLLLGESPPGVDVDNIKHDLLHIGGVAEVHELHVWRLNQTKSVASVHLVLSRETAAVTEGEGAGEKIDLQAFQRIARTVNKCLHAYGVHSVTIQPELVPAEAPKRTIDEKEWVVEVNAMDNVDLSLSTQSVCWLRCGNGCSDLHCCSV